MWPFKRAPEFNLINSRPCEAPRDVECYGCGVMVARGREKRVTSTTYGALYPSFYTRVDSYCKGCAPAYDEAVVSSFEKDPMRYFVTGRFEVDIHGNLAGYTKKKPRGG